MTEQLQQLPCPKCRRTWWWTKNTKPDEAICPPWYGCNDNTWHYQLMYHKVDMKSFVDGGYYAIHEYYPMEGGDGWTEQPIHVDGESVEEVKRVLQMMLEDIEKHGVKDYE